MKRQTMTGPDEEKIPFTAHLEELRTRLIRCIITVAIGTGVAYAYKEKIFDILVWPLVQVLPSEGKIIYTGLPEAFFTYLSVAFLTGILVSVPVIVYQFWMFVAPGLYKKERLYLAPIIIASLVFFISGALFGYFFVLPVGYKFFLGFSSDTIQAMPSMKEYLGFTSKMLLAFGFAFELPVVLTGLAALGIITPSFLRKNRKYSIVLAFIIGAILTPPDVISQVMMAVPLIVVYELGIFGAIIFGRKKTDDEEQTQDESASEEKADDKVTASEKTENP